MQLYTLLLAIFFSQNIFAKNDWCSIEQKKKCLNKPLKQIKLCFTLKPMRVELNNIKSYSAFIDRIKDVHYCKNYFHHEISHPIQMRNVLSSYAQECLEISDIRIYGHASSYSILNNHIQLYDFNAAFEIDGLINGSCLLQKGATIESLGSNTGHGCAGKTGMYIIAKQLLSKGGKVLAPSNYFLSYPLNTSINGKNLQLDYWNEKDTWTLQGTTDSSAKTLAQSCQQECIELKEKILTKRLALYLLDSSDIKTLNNCAHASTHGNSENFIKQSFAYPYPWYPWYLHDFAYFVTRMGHELNKK